MSPNEVRALHSPSQKAWANAHLGAALPRPCPLSLAGGKPGELFMPLMLRFSGGEMEAQRQAGAQVSPRAAPSSGRAPPPGLAPFLSSAISCFCSSALKMKKHGAVRTRHLRQTWGDKATQTSACARQSST